MPPFVLGRDYLSEGYLSPGHPQDVPDRLVLDRDRLHDSNERRLLSTEEPSVTNRASKNATQHEAAPLIARIHAIEEEEGHRCP